MKCRCSHPLQTKNARTNHPDFFIYGIYLRLLECDYEDKVELDILLELFDEDSDPSPVLTCPHCNHDLFVPKDVYDQIKGNFIYKVEDK